MQAKHCPQVRFLLPAKPQGSLWRKGTCSVCYRALELTHEACSPTVRFMFLSGTGAGLADKGILEGTGCVLDVLSFMVRRKTFTLCSVELTLPSVELPASASVPT